MINEQKQKLKQFRSNSLYSDILRKKHLTTYEL